MKCLPCAAVLAHVMEPTPTGLGQHNWIFAEEWVWFSEAYRAYEGRLTIPLATLLGLAERPGEAAGFGPLDPALARAMATAAATHPATTWCLTVTDQDGHPTAHGCARPTRHTGGAGPGDRTDPDGRTGGQTTGPAPARLPHLDHPISGRQYTTGPTSYPVRSAEAEAGKGGAHELSGMTSGGRRRDAALCGGQAAPVTMAGRSCMAAWPYDPREFLPKSCWHLTGGRLIHARRVLGALGGCWDLHRWHGRARGRVRVNPERRQVACGQDRPAGHAARDQPRRR